MFIQIQESLPHQVNFLRRKRLQRLLQIFDIMQGLEQIQRLCHILSQVLSLVLSQALSLVHSQHLSLVPSPTLSRILKRITIDLPLDTTLIEDPTLEVRPLIGKQRNLLIQLKWQTNMESYMMTWRLRRRISSFHKFHDAYISLLFI